MNKKRLFFMRTALAFFMVLCSVWGWGQGTLTIARSNFPSGTGYTTSTWTTTASTGETITGTSRLFLTTTSNIQIGGTETPHPYNITAVPGAITKIEIKMPGSGTLRSWTPRVSSNTAVTSATGGTSLSSQTFTSNTGTLSWNLNAADNYKYFYLQAGGNTNIASITITYQIPISNQPPTATNASIAGNLVKGAQLTGSYTYTDAENNTESGTTYKWYRADTNGGTKTAISGANSTTYTLTTQDVGKYIVFGVIPNDGTTAGSEAFSAYQGPVTSADPLLVVSGLRNLGSTCYSGGAPLQQTYTITNSGGSDANISNVSVTSSGFSIINMPDPAVVTSGGGTSSLTVQFNPAAGSSGLNSDQIVVTYDGGATATYNISATANPTVLASVQTDAATSVGTVSANLHGNLTNTGSCPATVEKGFVYGTTANPTIANSSIVVGSDPVSAGTFQQSLSALSPGTIYFYRAYARDANGGYIYGADQNFTTTVDAPTAMAASNIMANRFTANWNAVTGADSYELDVYTTADTPGNITTETFTTIGGGTASSYATRTWTGAGSIVWTAYKARTDEVVNTGNEAITLRNESGAYLESGVISNGISNLSFEVKQAFAGSGGVLTVKILTGATFTTTTTIGTIAYNTTKSTFESGAIGGITGDYKIVVENNASARPAIDNLSFTSAATSIKTYALNAENVGAITSYPVSNLTPETTYHYVVRAKSGATTSANSNEIGVITPGTTTWTGSPAAWSNGAPDAAVPVIIDVDYTGPSFESQSLTINAGKTLTVNSFVKTGDVINNGNIIVTNNANFVQSGTFTDGPGSTFKLRRDSNPVKRLGYIAWSSPLDGSAQTLKEFSKGKLADGTTVQSPVGTTDTRFFKYNNGTYVVVAGPSTATFTPKGQGFQIRTPNDFTTTTQPFHGYFEGTKPNTGAITYDASAINGQFVFLGNPYPSVLDMEAFYAANNQITGTFYIWNSAAEMTADVYTGTTYNTYNQTGTVPAGSAQGYVPVGQGFFVDRGVNTINSFTFNDAMRSTSETGVFAKAAVTDRFWLQMTAPSGAKPQMLIGFSGQATSAYDQGYDAKLFDNNSDVLYSKVENQSLIIDARASFNDTEAISVNANFLSAGNYTINILQKEGLFSNGQPIYLKDNVTGSVTDITANAYSFVATAGMQTNRFTILFKNPTLASSNVIKDKAIIFSAANVVHVKSSGSIKQIEIYDMSGKIIKQIKGKKSENQTVEMNYSGVVLVKVTQDNGIVTNNKVILKF